MERSEYHKYLASREWALLKRQVRERSKGKCERCHDGQFEECHHLTYEHIGWESLDDLQGVCSGCHKFLSGESDIDPAVKNDPKQNDSATYSKIIALQNALTNQIKEACARNDERQIDRLLRRKVALCKIQAQHIHFEAGTNGGSSKGHRG
jgi:hypothetical protein